VIRTFDNRAGRRRRFVVLGGNLFDAAIMKTSVISAEFRHRYLSDPSTPTCSRAAIVFDGPEDYHHRIDDPALDIDEGCIPVRPGGRPARLPRCGRGGQHAAPAELIRRRATRLPCIGDGRQSGTSGSPSILNASPEAAAGGGWPCCAPATRCGIDLVNGTANMLVADSELATRRADLDAAGGYPCLSRRPVAGDPAVHGRAALRRHGAGAAVAYQRVAQTKGIPRDNH